MKKGKLHTHARTHARTHTHTHVQVISNDIQDNQTADTWVERYPYIPVSYSDMSSSVYAI